MNVDFIAQPQAPFRVGDFLQQAFAASHWTEFRSAVAFVKRSGTQYIRDPLEAFSKRGGIVKISAGIDANGTSIEGLTDLLQAVDGRGHIFVFKNANESTFHPKIYLFKNKYSAEIVVGSGNLTKGGLFQNYEAGLLIRLTLEVPEDLAILNSVIQSLDEWSTPTIGLCYPLDAALLKNLALEGYLPNEKETRYNSPVITEKQNTQDLTLFTRHPVPPAPKVVKDNASNKLQIDIEKPNDDDDGNENLVFDIYSPVPSQAGTYRVFLMTLQKTDVGVGQTSEGTSRRSPEIFIPLCARDYDTNFWGWPALFESDAKRSGKMDRRNVKVRLGGATFSINMYYNPEKKDFRLRSENIRSAGAIGDILYIESSDGTNGFSYYVDIVPQSSSKHAEYLVKCTNTVPNSKKVFGYF